MTLNPIQGFEECTYTAWGLWGFGSCSRYRMTKKKFSITATENFPWIMRPNAKMSQA